MIIETTRFGDVDFPDDQILNFPDGLLGFEKEKQFALLPFTEEGDCPLEWMQSVQTPALAFIVTDPYIFISDYSLNLLESEMAEIGLNADDPVVVRVIVNIPQIYTDMTANLVGPLAVNRHKLVGKQFVLTTVKYDTRHYLFSEEIRKANSGVN